MIRVQIGVVIWLVLSVSASAQVTRSRITSYLERQNTKVYYWTVPLVAPCPPADSGIHFLAVKIQIPGHEATADSLILLKSGCEASDSVIFYFVPTQQDRGIRFLTPMNDTIKYVESGTLIAQDSEIVTRTRATLDALSGRLQRYGYLTSQINEYHAPLGGLLGAGLFTLGGALLASGGDYKMIAAGLSFGAAIGCGWIALRDLSRHDTQVKEQQEIEGQLPPGF